jgi:hypothetical protein
LSEALARSPREVRTPVKMLKAVVVSVLFSLQFSACGDGKSSKKTSPQPVPAPVNPGSAHIDETLPAAVDLRTHMVFDRRVSETARTALTRDLARVERFDLTTGTDNDALLKEILELPELSGGTLSTWLKARVRYMLNPDISLYRVGFVMAGSRSFQVTQLAGSSEDETRNVAAVMAGTALYSYGKSMRSRFPQINYLIVEVNDSWVHLNTQRNGVMQLGPALFNPDFMPNPQQPAAYANTAVRVDTLFHEARHADGNSVAGSLGFMHTLCPSGAGVAPEFVNQPACDDNANGPYTVGSRILKAYIQKCGDLCSARDKTILQSFYLDSVSRVVRRSGGQLPTLDATPEQGFERVDISTFSLIPSQRP